MPRPSRQTDSRGFTALEAIVAVTIFTVVMLIAITTFQGTHRMTRSATLQGDSQQSARLAVDVVTNDLRATGYGIDIGLGQPSLIHAAPWDIIVNANVTPGEDDLAALGFPRAMNPANTPATVPPGGSLYVPAQDFQTGAETIRYTIDSSGDGILDDSDLGDDAEESTPNPRDYVLRKEVYGELADNTNGGESVSAVYHSHFGQGCYLSQDDLAFASHPLFPFPEAAQIVVSVLADRVQDVGLFEPTGNAAQPFVGRRLEARS